MRICKNHHFSYKVFTLAAMLVLGISLCGCGGRDTTKEQDLRTQGIALMDSGNYSAALDVFNAALAESVGVVDELEVDIDLYKGIALYNLNRLDEALEVYNAIIDFDGKNELAYYYRGTVLLKSGDLAGATADYNELLKLENTYEMYTNVIENLREAGYTDVAAGYVSTALLLNAKTTDEQRYQAYLYYLNGDRDKARTTFSQLAQTGDEESLLYLSKYLIEDKDYSSALTYIEQGLSNKMSEYYGEFLFQKGVCYEYLQRYGDAREIFEQYLAIFPDDETAQREVTFLSTREDPEEEEN